MLQPQDEERPTRRAVGAGWEQAAGRRIIAGSRSGAGALFVAVASAAVLCTGAASGWPHGRLTPNLGFAAAPARGWGAGLGSRQGTCTFGRSGSALLGLPLPMEAAARAAHAQLGQGRGNKAGVLSAATMNFLELEEDERRDFREADIMGHRLFVTGLASTVDDVRLYLAFQNCGKILEAHVAKPGLGYVLFEDVESADQAVAQMESACLAGKEIKVKRARGFYIRMEAEARRRHAQKQREREMLGSIVAREISDRLRQAEDDHFQKTGVLSAHARDFDAQRTKRGIMRDMAREAMLAKRDKNGQRVDMPNSPYVDASHNHASAPPGLYRSVHDSVRNSEGEREVMVSQQEEEDRIRKQAMMEIMVEGDKLSKAERSQANDKTINMAQLIRERMDQIKRYEMLRENKELLGNITFTAAATPNSRTLVTDEQLAEEEKKRQEEEEAAFEDEDEDEDDDEIRVTDTEKELIKMIGGEEKKKQPARKAPAKRAAARKAQATEDDKPPRAKKGAAADAEAGKGSASKRDAKSGVDLTRILFMDDGEFERTYQPAGRGRRPASDQPPVITSTIGGAKSGAVDKHKATLLGTAKAEEAGKAPKRGRGRPPMEGKKKKTGYVPTGRPRGRPRKTVSAD